MAFIIDRHITIQGVEETRTSHVDAPTLHIGHGTGNELALHDVRVALAHASIERVGEAYVLKDLDSANGTYVNRQRVTACPLADQDTIDIGPYTLHVHLTAPDAPLTLRVEEPEAAAAPETAKPMAYFAKYSLSTSLITKSRITVVSLLVVLALAVIALSDLTIGPEAWHARTTLAPGLVAQAHQQFEPDCFHCHTTAWHNIPETACKTCHDGPVHQSTQVFTPHCTTCHTEHRGRRGALMMVADSRCTQCHADLRTTGQTPSRFATSIRSFTAGHPAFALTIRQQDKATATRVRLDRATVRDPARVHYNHAIHLKPDKLGSKGFERLRCGDCHQTDVQGAYMLPITYEAHCRRCHPLAFDPRFAPAPHDTPTVVRAFLEHTFTNQCLDLLLRPPETQESQAQAPVRIRPGRAMPAPQEEAVALQQCRDTRVQEAEQVLYADKKRQGCQLCHILQPPAATHPLPAVETPAIPQRWLPHSVFNHRVHARAERACHACHRDAATSEKASDILLPNLASCQQCHSATGGASTTCVTCHLYHGQIIPRQKSLSPRH